MTKQSATERGSTLITALIADDEPLARANLRRLLEQQGVTVLAEAENGPTALQMAEHLQPDLVALDICIPGLTGIQMAAALLHLHRSPLLIFVTGHAEHAVAAFEYDVLDYLVKPVAPERLAKTLIRVRERLADRRARQKAERQEMAQTAERPPLRRLPVRGEYLVRLVRVEAILFATAYEKRVLIYTAEGEHRTYYTLSQLEKLLPADRFLRTHDSWLVNLDAVRELLFLGNHNYMLRMDNDMQVPVGRTRYAELQRCLGLDATPAA
jgi:two-component system, LytTR family, response regulator